MSRETGRYVPLLVLHLDPVVHVLRTGAGGSELQMSAFLLQLFLPRRLRRSTTLS